MKNLTAQISVVNNYTEKSLTARSVFLAIGLTAKRYRLKVPIAKSLPLKSLREKADIKKSDRNSLMAKIEALKSLTTTSITSITCSH